MWLVQALCFCALFAIISGAVCPWQETGLLSWSSASTWAPLTVPTAGTNVTIKSGQKVLYDVITPGITYSGITILSGGELIMDGTKNVFLETNYVWVMEGASFRIGSDECHFTTKATITLVGPRDTTKNIGGLGFKHIGAHGNLEFFGNPPSPTWTNIAATVNVNSTTITVKDNLSNWNVGDVITLASTDYYQDLTEVFTITAISGKTITLNRPVKYLHWGADNEFAEVGHLTRNILVQGDASSDSSFFGGHCIVAGKGIGKVYGVEFTRMGQKGSIGRYPFHYHIMGDQIGRGHHVRESSFHDGYQRCLTVHGTSGVFVQNNVGFNVTGHCFFLEEGSETFNTYDHNLGMVVNPGTLIPTDANPSIFWITNPNNTWTNNVAVGGVFGFWFSLPIKPLGLTAYQTWVYPRFTTLIQFDNNLAHSASRNGIHCDDFPNADGTTTQGSWNPLRPPYSAVTAAYNTPAAPARLNFNNAYKNRQYGIWFKGGYFLIQNSLLIDNGIGVNTPGSGNLFYDSTIIAETENIGTPGYTRYYDDKGRSRPRLWDVTFPVHGWEGYDAAGLQFARNITFVNFTTNAIRRAGAVGLLPGGKNILPPNDMLSQMTLKNSNVFATVEPDAVKDGPRHAILIDADGSLTGAYGNTINSNGTIGLYASSCTKMDAWGGFYNCSQHPDGYSQIVVTNTNTAGTDFGSSLNLTYRATYIPFGYPNVLDNITGGDTANAIRTSYTTNVASRRGYLLKFPHPTPPQLQVSLRYPSTGEWVVVALQYPNTSFTVTRGYSNAAVTQVGSLSLLTGTTYYYDVVNQYLYVMYFADNGNVTAPTGFPMYTYDPSYVNILAGCGKTCTVNTGLPHPATYPDAEDKYKATLKGCTAGTSSTKVGNVYINFNKNSHFVTYTIYHNIPVATTGGFYSNGALIHNLTVAQAPIRGAFQISWNKHNSLWNGNWTIKINSAQNPTGEIAARIGCVGSGCSAPPKVSAFAPCTKINGENVLYSEYSLNATSGWADWSYNSYKTFNSTEDKQCGSYSAQVLFNSYSSLSLHMGLGDCNPGNCSASWMKPYLNVSSFKDFQFYIRSPSGPMPVPLVLQVANSKNVQIGPNYYVPFKYIDNYVVEETWTRVKVPLAELGFVGNELIGRFSIITYGNIVPGNYTMFVDEIKLVPSYSDPITKSPYGVVKTWVDVC